MSGKKQAKKNVTNNTNIRDSKNAGDSKDVIDSKNARYRISGSGFAIFKA